MIVVTYMIIGVLYYHFGYYVYWVNLSIYFFHRREILHFTKHSKFDDDDIDFDNQLKKVVYAPIRRLPQAQIVDALVLPDMNGFGAMFLLGARIQV